MLDMRRSSRSPLAGEVPQGHQAIFLLVHTDPQSSDGEHGRGWTITGYEGSDRRWSVALDVPMSAPVEHAQAAARRLLAHHGVTVVDWRHGASDREMYRADLLPTHWCDGSAWLG